MGIIDSNKFTITCPKCLAKEATIVHQKGSSYAASWQDGPEMKKFIAIWKDDNGFGPVVISAKCKLCEVEAIIE